ncbi:putative sulfate exporter family transporter [Bradyrhizobium sediminis]|uniref:Sulfate exporter family transporter n=1 Tax=Bradyrhizobium sediminis TaxID=2840469 RepID=A0A975NSL2_9BRAD|nr:putative sulfate exporter family transporter [Bradyrhizobium sediminis]
MSNRIDSPDEVRLLAGTIGKAVPLLWGIALCALVTLAAVTIQAVEESLVGHPYVEAIVIAILLGTAIRTLWEPGRRWRAGIAFSAKQLLEVAVALLGASLTFAAIGASGFALLGSVVALVILSLAVSFGISRSLGLPVRLSILIACGNSICGNSAIAAVAPVIGASTDDVASSISFTAVLGVIVVLGLPLLIPLLQLSETQYGILAGMTVYAVPQVLAATVPAGLVSTQVGTLVKLIRVMMLGPVVACIAVAARGLRGDCAPGGSRQNGFFQAVPWFIVAFFLLATFRSLSWMPDAAVFPIRKTAGILTVMSMAALGLGVDLRVIGRIGGKVTAAVTLSLLFLLVISLCLVRFVAAA